MSTVADLGELRLLAELEAIFGQPSDPRVLRGIGDDCAVVRSDQPLAWTVDSVVAGVDWLPEHTPPEAIGHRAAAVNLSDLAAMGARPLGLLLALELPPEADVGAVLASARGLQALAARHGAAVVGGDLGLSPGPARWTVTALGELGRHRLSRRGARVGDTVWLAGELGLAALGLALLQRGDVPTFGQAAVRAHLWPEPLVELGCALAELDSYACLDVSDGLGLDAHRLALASGVALELDVPRPAWLTDDWQRFEGQHFEGQRFERQPFDWRRAVASGGDDYALLAAGARWPGPGWQAIGRVVAGAAGTVALRVDGVAQAVTGFQHGAPQPARTLAGERR
jgi:thiamine-monophosphate kinase